MQRSRSNMVAALHNDQPIAAMGAKNAATRIAPGQCGQSFVKVSQSLRLVGQGVGEEPGGAGPAVLLGRNLMPETVGTTPGPAALKSAPNAAARPSSALTQPELLELLISPCDWLWEIDADLRFSWLSENYFAVTGMDPATVLGRFRFDFLKQVSLGSKSVDAHLDDLQSRRPFTNFVYEIKGGREGFRWVSISGSPRFDTDGTFLGYRGTGRDVSSIAASLEEFQKLHGELARQEERGRVLSDTIAGESHAERMMTALDVMSDAFCYYDRDDALVLYNEALVSMYGRLADIIRPGLRFDQFLDIGLKRGIWRTEGESAEHWRDAMLLRRNLETHSQSLLRMTDGRTIIHREFRTDDGGTIATCADITEIESRNTELARAAEETRRLLCDLERTLDSMTMGVVLLDADLRIEIINKAFHDLWKIEPGTVPVGSPFRALMDVNRYNGVYDVQPGFWEIYVSSRLNEIRNGNVAPREFLRADGRAMIYSVTTLSGGKRLVCYYDISEVKRRETEALEARRRLATVLESIPAGIVIYDRDGQFVLANHRLKEALPKIAAAFAPGVSLTEMAAATHAAGYGRHSGYPDLDALYDSDPQAWIEGFAATYRVRHAVTERRDQDGRWFQVTNMRTDDGAYICLRTDISDIKQREKALRKSMGKIELFRHVLDELPVSIYVKSADLAFEYVNKAWCDIGGIAKEDAIGKTDRDFFGAEGDGFALRDLEVLATGVTNETVEVLTHRDGVARELIARKSRLISSDGSVHLIGSSSDVSELKARERELQEAQCRAVLADRAKSEFLANMSHEIRTPMNGVLGMAELLSRSNLDPKQKTFTDIIVKSGNALLTIINDILDFSKIDAGQLLLDPAPFRLAEAVEDVVTLISTRAKEKDLELIVRVEPGLCDMFVGDVGRIRQIITNLVGNAVKFTDSGHVLVDVTGNPGDTETRLRIAVTDTGIGIPAEKLKMVFEKFSQVDASSTRRHEGTGLGLAISSRLVGLMGGEIGVDSVEGKGSTFWFTITLPNSGSRERRRVMPVDVTGARILIVDDNAVNRAILSEQMAAWSFDSCAVENGADGVKVLMAAAAQGVAVDCVVLDYQMPGMSGAEMARIVRMSPGIAGTPIVLLTSVDQSFSNQAHRDAGIDAHLVKPARSSALLETLVATIQKHRGMTGDQAATVDQADGVATALPVAPTAPARGPAEGDDGKHRIDILVAEDNEVNQLVFAQILGETQYTFGIVGNGRLALKAFAEMNPRMILMDISMPQMSGLEATVAIRDAEMGSGHHIPIVGVTAHALKGDRERCLEAGMDDYLPKPISPRALIDKIERWIWRNGQESRDAG